MKKYIVINFYKLFWTEYSKVSVSFRHFIYTYIIQTIIYQVVNFAFRTDPTVTGSNYLDRCWFVSMSDYFAIILVISQTFNSRENALKCCTVKSMTLTGFTDEKLDN